MDTMLAAGRWGDFIEWLEGHDASALVLAAFLTFLATTILAGVTAFYAKKTADIAGATRRQADATAKMAEAALCPVIEQSIGERVPLDPDTKVKVKVEYQNTGGGHAVYIRWFLRSADERLVDTQWRVGMGPRAEQRSVDFDLDASVAGAGLRVDAEYGSVLGTLWRSRLPLCPQTRGATSYLENGEPEFVPIPKRTVPEEGTP